MAIVDYTGITPVDLAGYRRLFEQKFRDAFGADLSFDEETPQAQWIGIASLVAAELDEVLVAEANGLNRATAAGFQLDDLGSMLGLTRFAPTRSTAVVSLTGVASTVVPAGSRIRGTNAEEFQTTAQATIAAGGTDVNVEAIEYGPIPAEVGTLTEIVTPVAGWTGVTNPAAAVVGRYAESDTAYRCLLYTSPSPRDRQKSRMPSSA